MRIFVALVSRVRLAAYIAYTSHTSSTSYARTATPESAMQAPAPARRRTMMLALAAGLCAVLPVLSAAPAVRAGGAILGAAGLLQPPVAALQPNGAAGSGDRVLGLASGAAHPAPHAAVPSSAQAAGASALPASADISQYSPPIAYQGPVASCVAWVTAYYMRGYYAKRDGYYPSGGPDSSGSFAPMYVFSQAAKGKNDGITFNAALDLMQAQGIDTRADYTQGDTNYSDLPTPSEQANAANYKISAYTVLFQGANQGASAQQAIETSIAAGDPVGLGLPVYDPFWNADATHDYVDIANLGTTNHGNHAVVAAKYDANGVWVENQWGTGWGLNGWVELSWAFVDQYVWQAVTIHPAAAPTNVPSSQPANTATTASTAVPTQAPANTATATNTAIPTQAATSTAVPALNATSTATPIVPAPFPPPATATPAASHNRSSHPTSIARHQPRPGQRTRTTAPATHHGAHSRSHSRSSHLNTHQSSPTVPTVHTAMSRHSNSWLSGWKAQADRPIHGADLLHGFAVRLGTPHNRHADAVYRDIALPVAARHVTLRLTYRTLRLAGATPRDSSRLVVEVLNPRTGRLLARALRITPQVASQRKGLMMLPRPWHTVSYDLTRFRGRRVRLLFRDRHGRGASVIFDVAAVRVSSD